MNPSGPQTTQHIMTGATLGGGLLEWLTVNSSAVTAIAVMTTAVTSIGLGYWNAKSNSERNRINKRDIVASLVSELKRSGKTRFDISELEDKLMK